MALYFGDFVFQLRTELADLDFIFCTLDLSSYPRP